jgi:hypothetical protein
MTMSLGRLLAAGRSLVGGRDDAGRYRTNKHVALPKFISPRNPFASEVKSEASPAHAESVAKDRGAKSAGITTKADVDTTVKADLRTPMSARATRWLGEWRQKLNPLPRLVKRPGPAKSVIPHFAKSPVQPELSLDQVKVVRNDLSDADLEIVPVKAPVASGSAEPAEKFAMAGNTWDRLTTKFFGVGPT